MMTGAARQRGFTLIEVMVAFIIAALALSLLFQTASTSGTAAHQAGYYEEAVSRAKSHMAMVGRDADVAPGEREGDDGGGFRWRVKVTRSAAAQPPQDAAPQNRLVLYDVEVSVSWVDSGRARSVVLHTQRLGTQANG
jgi:general secretion pathway protein I